MAPESTESRWLRRTARNKGRDRNTSLERESEVIIEAWLSYWNGQVLRNDSESSVRSLARSNAIRDVVRLSRVLAVTNITVHSTVKEHGIRSATLKSIDKGQAHHQPPSMFPHHQLDIVFSFNSKRLNLLRGVLEERLLLDVMVGGHLLPS